MSGEGIPTLQVDQLNIIVHHLHKINTEEDLWPDKEEWPHQLDLPKILPIQLSLNKLIQKKLQQTPEWPTFLKSEWKQLSRYKDASMFGDPIKIKN